MIKKYEQKLRVSLFLKIIKSTNDSKAKNFTSYLSNKNKYIEKLLNPSNLNLPFLEAVKTVMQLDLDNQDKQDNLDLNRLNYNIFKVMNVEKIKLFFLKNHEIENHTKPLIRSDFNGQLENIYIHDYSEKFLIVEYECSFEDVYLSSLPFNDFSSHSNLLNFSNKSENYTLSYIDNTQGHFSHRLIVDETLKLDLMINLVKDINRYFSKENYEGSKFYFDNQDLTPVEFLKKITPSSLHSLLFFDVILNGLSNLGDKDVYVKSEFNLNNLEINNKLLEGNIQREIEYLKYKNPNMNVTNYKNAYHLIIKSVEKSMFIFKFYNFNKESLKTKIMDDSTTNQPSLAIILKRELNEFRIVDEVDREFFINFSNLITILISSRQKINNLIKISNDLINKISSHHTNKNKAIYLYNKKNKKELKGTLSQIIDLIWRLDFTYLITYESHSLLLNEFQSSHANNFEYVKQVLKSNYKLLEDKVKNLVKEDIEDNKEEFFKNISILLGFATLANSLVPNLISYTNQPILEFLFRAFAYSLIGGTIVFIISLLIKSTQKNNNYKSIFSFVFVFFVWLVSLWFIPYLLDLLF